MILPSMHQNGLEVGDTHARLVRIHQTKRQSKILAAVEATSLHELLSATPRKYRKSFIVLAMPSSHVFLRAAHIEESDFANFDRAVITEAQRHLPHSLDELSLDWAVYRQDGHHRHVQIAAVKQAVVQKFGEALVEQGVTPIAFESEALALVRAVLPAADQQKGEYVLCDLREDRLLVVVFVQGGIEASFVHEPVGWKRVLEKVRQSTGTEEEDAKKAVLAKGVPDRKKGKNSLQAAGDLSEVLGHIQDALEFYQDRFQRKPQLLISGYLRILPNITELLKKKFQQECVMATSAHHFPKDSKDRVRVEKEPQWDIALGEALYHVSL